MIGKNGNVIQEILEKSKVHNVRIVGDEEAKDRGVDVAGQVRPLETAAFCCCCCFVLFFVSFVFLLFFLFFFVIKFCTLSICVNFKKSCWKLHSLVLVHYFLDLVLLLKTSFFILGETVGFLNFNF